MRVSFSKVLGRAAASLVLWVTTAPALAAVQAPERVIDLQGTSNTRDIGGYLAAEGRQVRYGQIIRSENLSRLTAEDFRRLEALGVKTVIDLRTQSEHDHDPTVWQGDQPPRFYHFPVGDADDAWYRNQRRMVKHQRFTAKQSSRQMADGYRMIADIGPASYGRLMEVVLDEANWPILIHCNAGKDRAGVATALILEALGVDRETIMDEYLLTNEISRADDKAELLARERRSRSLGRSARGPSAEAWFPLVGVQPEMLEAFYARVDERHGSMDAYLAELGVDEQRRQQLRATLTVAEPALAQID